MTQYFDPTLYKQSQTMNYASQNDQLWSLRLLTANYTNEVLFDLQKTIITLNQNMYLPEWGTKPTIDYYRLHACEQRSYASQQNLVQIIME